ncbi:hypothetical protein H5410_045156 [Solanum commersonii]|uniref:Uncharacterized protein n=1 Tax=Solanum commersonii TaxID=4109 RepID=A0A9J5XA90_SOLCO|nr:hypothetical protein H5410_045156 [Solanum commersonii]
MIGIYRKGWQTDRTGSTGPVLSEPVLVTGFRYRNWVLPEPVLPKISKGSVRSLSYWIGIGLDRTGTGSYRIIVYR